jgi:hypothetical protein
MKGLALIENLHRTTGLGGLMWVPIRGNLQSPVVTTGVAGDSIQSIAGPNGSNLLLPGWRDIHLSPPNPTARASSPPSTPTGLTRRGFFFVQPGKSSSLLRAPTLARAGRRVTGMNAASGRSIYGVLYSFACEPRQRRAKCLRQQRRQYRVASRVLMANANLLPIIRTPPCRCSLCENPRPSPKPLNLP